MSNTALQATRFAPQDNSAGVDSVLLGSFISLLMLGLIMVFSSTIAMGDQDLSTNTAHFWRQLVHVVIGVSLTVAVACVPVWLWKKLSLPLLAVAIVLLLVLIFVGIEVNGSTRWFSVAGFRFQPAEFAKIAIVLYTASYLTRRQAEIKKFSKGIVNIAIVVAVIGCLLLMQPDFGSFVVMTATVGLMMFLGGIRVSHTLLCLAVVGIAMFFMISLSPYRMERFIAYLDPWADPYGAGFQLTQALIAVGRGEIFGVGLGASIQKLYYLPHANNDFILAVIAEELGLVGIILVVGLYGVLLQRALMISRVAELVGRVYAARLAQGVGFLLVFQAVINIGVNLGVLPTKGLTLPFISYGGSSMLVCCIAMGLLFGVDRQNRTGELKKGGVQ
ncbi:putative lipid II flippase FtsW [Arenicella xantha]|uniref:Probable peptidoglycan glycosyltransferase FtsW n=1 Tax=Arenicella xantha TaxID=644221 RepID=A0A395JIL3_9GAMM|nr:putative lipid II flippase FtsW [Arenicella xantha]RBP49865.1 cell division-specific peptidoglycan biosynthesis regulator FtsW [Arenicella xantha]